MRCRLLGLFAVLLLAAVPALRADAPRLPNVVIIVSDDQGYADAGFQGCKDIPTPHLDALASSGVRFTSGYVSGPYCSPTRAGLMTGRYQQRFGHEFNPTGGKGKVAPGLPVSEATLADRLRAAGYATGLVGKWHLGGASRFHPQKRGFDEFFGFLGGMHSYVQGKGVLRGTAESGEKEYLTDALGREAVDFIDRHKAKPFFLYLAFNAVHTPMQADDARLKKFSALSGMRRTYAAMLFAMDEAIGKVRAKLRDAGLEKDTLIVFFSDNGGPTMKGTTINGSVNTPLRGSKRTTLEGGIRVPFVLSWSGKVKPGVYDQPIIQLDAHATALAAAGISVKPEWKLDGVDLLPYLSGAKKDPPHEALYWRLGPQMAIRAGDWKLVRYDPTADGMSRKGGGATVAKLYNLADDVGEAKDLAAAMPERVKELQARWDAWSATLAKPLWGGAAAK
jgi:arylsulfatase A-like enzyme